LLYGSTSRQPPTTNLDPTLLLSKHLAFSVARAAASAAELGAAAFFGEEAA